MHSILAWASAHPEAALVLVTTAVNFIFGWLKLFSAKSRAVAFVAKIVAAIFPDPHELIDAVMALIKKGPPATGAGLSKGLNAVPPPPPKPPTVDRRRLMLAFATAAALSLAPFACVSTTGCANLKQAENGVFAVEQLICMTSTLAADFLSGDAQQDATYLVKACQIAPALTTDVIKFINQFAAKKAEAKRLHAALLAKPDGGTP